MTTCNKTQPSFTPGCPPPWCTPTPRATFLGQGSLWKSDKSYKIIIPEDTAHIQNFKGGGSFMGHWLRTSALNLTSSSARSCQLLLPLISLPLGSIVSEKFPRDVNSLQPSSSISTLTLTAPYEEAWTPFPENQRPNGDRSSA